MSFILRSASAGRIRFQISVDFNRRYAKECEESQETIERRCGDVNYFEERQFT